LLNETLLETIIATAGSQKLDAIVVDSIQTVFTSDLEGAPGNVGQVRECAARLMRFAKETETTVFAVGHVTKGGGIAGPKTLEHIVDTVLYFEGEECWNTASSRDRTDSASTRLCLQDYGRGSSPSRIRQELFLGDRLNTFFQRGRTAGRLASVLIGFKDCGEACYGTPQRVSTGFDGRRLALFWRAR
jgi:DNA repair protein RadA/Sms